MANNVTMVLTPDSMSRRFFALDGILRVEWSKVMMEEI